MREDIRHRLVMGTLAAVLTAGYVGILAQESSKPKPPVQQVQKPEITLELIAAESGGHKAIHIKWNKAYKVEFVKYSSLWYEIPDIIAKSDPFTVTNADGDNSRIANLPQPEDLNGKELFIYGEGNPEPLYRTVINLDK